LSSEFVDPIAMPLVVVRFSVPAPSSTARFARDIACSLRRLVDPSEPRTGTLAVEHPLVIAVEVEKEG